MVQNQHHQSTTSPITNILFAIHKSSQFFKIHESLHISPRTRPCSAHSQFAILDPRFSTRSHITDSYCSFYTPARRRSSMHLAATCYKINWVLKHKRLGTQKRQCSLLRSRNPPQISPRAAVCVAFVVPVAPVPGRTFCKAGAARASWLTRLWSLACSDTAGVKVVLGDLESAPLLIETLLLCREGVRCSFFGGRGGLVGAATVEFESCVASRATDVRALGSSCCTNRFGPT